MTAELEDIQARIHYSGYQAFDRAARQIRLPPSAASAPVPENARQRWHAGGYLRRLQEIGCGSIACGWAYDRAGGAFWPPPLPVRRRNLGALHALPKTGGLLLANNSHGDASMASIDDDALIAVAVRRKGKHRLSERDLDAYFIPQAEVEVTRAHFWELGHGIEYTKSASSYVFRRVG